MSATDNTIVVVRIAKNIALAKDRCMAPTTEYSPQAIIVKTFLSQGDRVDPFCAHIRPVGVKVGTALSVRLFQQLTVDPDGVFLPQFAFELFNALIDHL